MSIGKVEITKGEEKPIDILINMTNSAGVFQIREILYKNLVAGVAGRYIDIIAQTVPGHISTDERICKITVQKGKFVHTK